jgi:hypothetical protein
MNEMNGFNNHGRASPHRLGDRLQVQGEFFIFEDSERWTCTGGCIDDSINGGPAVSGSQCDYCMFKVVYVL